MEKTTKKESLISQLKALPNQVKVFILGLFVVVLALASILPNLNSKSLQGNVLNAKSSSKVDGYGYGYGSVPLWPLWNCSLVQTNTETKISCPRQWWASYSEELQGAYNYAYQMGLTTQPTIDSADMYGSLTRIAFAKMISSYVLQLGLQTPNTSLECSFSDVSTALDAQYNNWVTTLCQLGLVGNWTQNFRPFDLITRAEFGTMLSRAIWGDANNGGEPYYINHLNALKSAGIMNNINPNIIEIRGYVMLMLQRTHENVIANICQLPENVLACSLMLNDCPSQCRPAQCQIPENVLACSLGLDSCPQECIYEWWLVRDVTITKATFAAANSKEAKVTVEVENVWNVNMNLNGIGHDFYVWDGYGYGTQQDHWQMSVEVVDHFVPTLSPWQKDQFVIYVKAKDIPFSKDSYVFLNVISNGDQNAQNNNKKVRIEGNIKPDLWDIIDVRDREKTEVEETPAVEETTPAVVETPAVIEETEEVSKEKADSLLEMVRNIFK